MLIQMSYLAYREYVTVDDLSDFLFKINTNLIRKYMSASVSLNYPVHIVKKTTTHSSNRLPVRILVFPENKQNDQCTSFQRC